MAASGSELQVPTLTPLSNASPLSRFRLLIEEITQILGVWDDARLTDRAIEKADARGRDRG